jgi:hypothetical protein
MKFDYNFQIVANKNYFMVYWYHNARSVGVLFNE